jgi:hypothetical protein
MSLVPNTVEETTLMARKVDPVDHSRTFRQHAGESFTYGANAPGFIGAAVAVVSVVVGLFMFATGRVTEGAIAVAVAALVGAGSAIWVARTHRKVREDELRWHAANSDEPAPPPSS